MDSREFIDYCNERLAPNMPQLTADMLGQCGFERNEFYPYDFHQVTRFLNNKKKYPLSRQSTSTQLETKPSHLGRPRKGEWRLCVICDTRFYARPSRLNKAQGITCGNTCANKITGKLRHLKSSSKFDNMLDGEIDEYLINLIPFQKEKNPEAWAHIFDEAKALVIDGIATRQTGGQEMNDIEALKQEVAKANDRLTIMGDALIQLTEAYKIFTERDFHLDNIIRAIDDLIEKLPAGTDDYFNSFLIGLEVGKAIIRVSYPVAFDFAQDVAKDFRLDPQIYREILEAGAKTESKETVPSE